jgi:hypothetical protein
MVHHLDGEGHQTISEERTFGVHSYPFATVHVFAVCDYSHE